MSTAPLKSPAFLETAKLESSRMAIIGFVLAIMGIIAMASPLIAGGVVSMMVGVLLTASGLGQTIFAMQSGPGVKRIANLLFGVLSVVCGTLMIGHPLFGLKFMTMLLLAFFLVSGVGEILHAVQLRPVKGWGWVLTNGLVSLLLGILIWQSWPLSGAWAIGVLVGVKMLMCGISLAVLGIAARTMVSEEQART